MNVTQIIDAFGGYEDAALLFGVSRSLLTQWEQDGIPSKRWRQIVALAEMKNIKNITIESLADSAASKPPRQARQAA